MMPEHLERRRDIWDWFRDHWSTLASVVIVAVVVGVFAYREGYDDGARDALSELCVAAGYGPVTDVASAETCGRRLGQAVGTQRTLEEIVDFFR